MNQETPNLVRALGRWTGAEAFGVGATLTQVGGGVVGTYNLTLEQSGLGSNEGVVMVTPDGGSGVIVQGVTFVSPTLRQITLGTSTNAQNLANGNFMYVVYQKPGT